ncbi:unnamed protein product [Urochloa humidicola]
MALQPRRAGVLLQLLVVVLALAAAFSCACAARAPEILHEAVEAAAPDQQGQAPAGSDAAVAVEHVAVVDKSVFGTGHHHGHHYSNGNHKHRHSSAPGGRDGVWRAAGLAATVTAAAWLL